MIELFHTFERVLYHILLFYQSSTVAFLGANSYWVAIVLMTLTVRAALLPLVVKQVRSARAMRAIQPQLKALRERHGKDQAKLMAETTRLTREHGVNPLAGCLPLLAQAPVFIALSRVIWSPTIDGQPNVLRGHLAAGVDLGSSLAGMSWAERLTSPGGLLILGLIVVAAVTTTITQRLAMAQQPTPLPDSQRRLLQLMPLFFPLMWIRFPLAAIMYWVTSNLWTLGQQWVVSRSNPPLPAIATAAAAAAAAAPSGSKDGTGGKAGAAGKGAGAGAGRGDRRPAANGASTKRASAGSSSSSGKPAGKPTKRPAQPGQGQRQAGGVPAAAPGGGQGKRARRRAAQDNSNGARGGDARSNGARRDGGNGARNAGVRGNGTRGGGVTHGDGGPGPTLSGGSAAGAGGSARRRRDRKAKPRQGS